MLLLISFCTNHYEYANCLFHLFTQSDMEFLSFCFTIILVYKEPPYVLKESGYASFNLPIDIYFKAGARDEPKKFSTLYDLDISKTTVQKYSVIVPNPSSEFRHKLLEGGGIMMNSDSKFRLSTDCVGIIMSKWSFVNDDLFCIFRPSE